MGSICAGSARRWTVRALVALWIWLAAGVFCAAQVPAIVRVEEDWEMVVGTPDPDSNAPQVTTAISPVGHVQSVYATLVINYQSLLSYEPGGLQLQVWDGETPVTARLFPNPNVMATPGETVRWTQTMELRDGKLSFEIIGGSSSTWGSFGGQGYLKASVPVDLPNLNGYDPAVSVANSGVSYAANRVETVRLAAIRLFTASGEQFEDRTVRVVHQR